MKKYCLEFVKRGLMVACGGPVVVSIVLFILELCNVVSSLTPSEILLANITSSLLAFIIAGASIFHQIDKISPFMATTVHLIVLYIAHLFIYLLNGWLKNNIEAFLIFTLVFVLGYFVIWGIVVICTKQKAKKLNNRLKTIR